MKNNRAYLFATANKDGIYYGGGFAPMDSNIINTFNNLEFFSPIEPLQIKEFPQNEIFTRVYSSALMKNNSIYVIGGSKLFDTNFISEYNVETRKVVKSFSGFSSNNESLFGMMCGEIENNIYIFGGVENFVSQTISKIDFNLKNEVYEYSTLLEPRAFGSAIVLKDRNQIYLVGGFNEIDNALNSVEVISFSGSKMSSQFGSELNIGRTDLMAAEYNNNIYVFGGYNKNKLTESSVEMLTLKPTSVDVMKNNIPAKISLGQNYPNPYNPTTTIEYTIPVIETNLTSTANVVLKVYDILGKEVAVLINKHQSAGTYTIVFNADEFNITSGVYYYSIWWNGHIKTNKMLLTK
jgi:hypothetical protein